MDNTPTAPDVTTPLNKEPALSTQTMPPGSRRPDIPGLTSIRGFAAVWVFLYHYYGLIEPLFSQISILRPLLRCGSLAVPLFFILSGHVLYMNYGEKLKKASWAQWQKFWVFRLARIYPVHLATLLACVVIVCFAKLKGIRYDENNYSLQEFILHLLLVQTWNPYWHFSWNAASWSISSEWFAYLVFPIACPIMALVKRARLTTVIWTLAFGCLMTWVVAQGENLPMHALIQVVPTFFCGCGTAMLATFVHSNRRIGSGAAAAVLFAIMALPFIVTDPTWRITFLLPMFAVQIYLLAIDRNEGTNLFNHPVSMYLGEISYSLYMTHELLYLPLLRIETVYHFDQASFAFRLCSVLAIFVIAAVACLSTYYFVERPARQWFRTLAEKHAKQKVLISHASETLPGDSTAETART